MALFDNKVKDYLSHSSFACMIVTANGIPLAWNRAAENLLPQYFGTGNAKQKSIFDFFNECGITNIFQKLTESTDVPIVIEWMSPSNKDFKATLEKQQDNNYFIILNDITQQKQHDKLVQSEKEETIKSKKIHKQFLANVSHDIRTPIQTIIGMMELLRTTKLDQEQKEYIRQINFSAEILLELVNDILDFSKLEVGSMQFENIPFDLVSLMESSIDFIAIEGHKKGLEILLNMSPALNPYFIGDPSRLKQILLNLMKNAVKFTEKGSVTVDVFEAELPDKDGKAMPALYFEIADTGIGITDEQKEKLFTVFYQTEASVSRRFGGTGLGLAISKNIIKMLNGEIGVKDNKPHGSIFWFKLPMMQAKKQECNHTILLKNTTKILIVDDNLNVHKYLSKLADYIRFSNVFFAKSGKEALKLLRESAKSDPFQICFIDMIMPRMDGWRLGAEIHNDPEISSCLLFLMIPEGVLRADAKMKLLTWFSGYLYKPLKKETLLRSLNTAAALLSDTATEPLEELESVEDYEEDTSVYFFGLKILVVEDHPVNRQLIKALLEKSGCIVTAVEDGKKAVEIACTKPFDLIFMDIQLPFLNGYEATAKIRELGIKTVIIACTASAQENEEDSYLACGMNDVLTKPFNRETLIKLLKKYFPNM
ncbi:response regulator [Treponema phagedenis]|uniref:response regulator n=1 Tax=Treponema phagedenis TaxID=162 RepID=UPI0011F08415|nr:response regulator [Treponema phagedenis]TYT78390.1 response regulator [Treponema phagedenis]